MADGAYEPFPPVEAWAEVPYDPSLYEEHAALLDTARAEATGEARERAVRTAIRYAGTDTGAIEGLYTTDRGFTRTVAIEAAAWEAAANERGPNAANIIKDQIEAYEWVLDPVTQKVPVTEHIVRELHAKICRSQEKYVVYTDLGRQERPLPKGDYKTFPNNPTSLATGRIHHYAPPDDVPAEMHRLVDSMSSPAYEALHPVVQAAYVHYAVAAIHPFADGNGRTARAVASVPLYRDRAIPLMILADERDEYLDTLGAADAGDIGAFVGFVRDRVIDTMQLVTLTLRAAGDADQAKSIDALRRVITSAGGRTHAEMDALAHRLLEALREEVEAQFAEFQFPAGVTTRVESVRFRFAGPDGYRSPVTAPSALVVTFISAPPASASTTETATVFVTTGDASPPFQLGVSGQLHPFELRDVEPHVRQLARLRLATIAESVLSTLLASLAEQAEAALRQGGYRG